MGQDGSCCATTTRKVRILFAFRISWQSIGWHRLSTKYTRDTRDTQRKEERERHERERRGLETWQAEAGRKKGKVPTACHPRSLLRHRGTHRTMLLSAAAGPKTWSRIWTAPPCQRCCCACVPPPAWLPVAPGPPAPASLPPVAKAPRCQCCALALPESEPPAVTACQYTCGSEHAGCMHCGCFCGWQRTPVYPI
eukprot:364282-Chlamydomonas_euryale.AAC.28